MRSATALTGTWLALLAAGAAAPAEVGPAPATNAPLVTYVANEGFLLEHGGKKVLIDALFQDGFGTYAAPSSELLDRMVDGQDRFADVDLLLVTHPHADHFEAQRVLAFLRHHPRCHLAAHTQTIDRLRSEDGFAQIEGRIHEIALAPGERESWTVNGIALDTLCLEHAPYYRDGRNVHAGRPNLAFAVSLGGTRFFHMGDSTIENSLAHLSAFPFDTMPVDILFVAYFDRSLATRELIGRRIKPSRIVAMHVPPAKLSEELQKTWKASPWAVVFRKSMEQRSVPIEVDFHDLTGDYFGQPEPGTTPQPFARGIVSTDLQEHGAPSFSPDGNQVVWTSNRKPGPDNEDWIVAVLTMRREDGRWSAPYVPSFSLPPAFSTDGRRGYFAARRPGAEREMDYDVWFVERQGDGWSEPRCLGLVARYPDLRFAVEPSVTRDGTLYFIGYTPGPLNDYGIYRSELVDGEYARPELLPRSINLPPFLNWTHFVPPDESYLLFSSSRAGDPDDYGDLYISRREADGNWTDPVSLGEPVNTKSQERIPAVSSDGKYLFFSRQTPDHDEDVFWVEAAAVPPLHPSTTPASHSPSGGAPAADAGPTWR